MNAPPPPYPPLDINRETVVQLYFQSSLSRELRFCDDQLVKLLRLPFPTLYIYIYIYIYIVIYNGGREADSLSVLFPFTLPSVFSRTATRRASEEKAEGREKAKNDEKEEERERERKKNWRSTGWNIVTR